MILPGYLFQYYSRSTGGRSSERGGERKTLGGMNTTPGKPRNVPVVLDGFWHTWKTPDVTVESQTLDTCHYWEKYWCSNFRLRVTSLKVSNQKTERMKKSTYNWAKKFQSKSKWHKTIELFLCLFLQILTVHIVEDGFASAEVSTLCQVPRSKVTKKKNLRFFHQPSDFWDKKGGF